MVVKFVTVWERACENLPRRARSRFEARRSGAALLPACRVGDRRLEAACDGLALAVDRLDVAVGDLLLEEGIGHCDRLFRARHEQAHQE